VNRFNGPQHTKFFRLRCKREPAHGISFFLAPEIIPQPPFATIKGPVEQRLLSVGKVTDASPQRQRRDAGGTVGAGGRLDAEVVRAGVAAGLGAGEPRWRDAPTDSKMLALYGRNCEGVDLQSNLTTCPATPISERCQ